MGILTDLAERFFEGEKEAQLEADFQPFAVKIKAVAKLEYMMKAGVIKGFCVQQTGFIGFEEGAQISFDLSTQSMPEYNASSQKMNARTPFKNKLEQAIEEAWIIYQEWKGKPRK